MAAEPERGLAEYVSAVAAGTATPGGGSAVAVVGALAAALGEMVVNLTRSNRKYANAAELLQPGGERLSALRGALLAAAAADEHAYAGYRQAVSMPRGNETEQRARDEALERSIVAATEAPLGVARDAAEVARILQSVAALGNPRLLSDAALAALLAEAAVRGAARYVKENAALLRDTERARATMLDADGIVEDGVAAAEQAWRLAVGDVSDGVEDGQL